MSIQRYGIEAFAFRDRPDDDVMVADDTDGDYVLFTEHEKAALAEFHRGYKTGKDRYEQVGLDYGERKYDEAIRDCIKIVSEQIRRERQDSCQCDYCSCVDDSPYVNALYALLQKEDR